jgi:HPt (histidine-containing phosphotransfer) domain-containing protein
VEPDEPLDQIILDNLRSLEIVSGKTILPQLVGSFARATPARLAKVRAAISALDTGVVYHEVHTLKGTSANLGARLLAPLCTELELLAQASNLSGALDIVGRLEMEFERAVVALERATTNTKSA